MVGMTSAIPNVKDIGNKFLQQTFFSWFRSIFNTLRQTLYYNMAYILHSNDTVSLSSHFFTLKSILI